MPKEIPVVFHNGSTYDYHFIIKQLAKEFTGKFNCLGENTAKYITFSVPIKKDLDNGKEITYKRNLLIVVDLCQYYYQVLLIIYRKLIIWNVKNVWKQKKIRSECKFIGFKNNRLNYK